MILQLLLLLLEQIQILHSLQTLYLVLRLQLLIQGLYAIPVTLLMEWVTVLPLPVHLILVRTR